MQPSFQDQSYLILEIPDCELYEIKGGQQTRLQSGSLKVLEIAEYNLFFLVLSDFRYSLSKEINVMTTDEPMEQRIYVFPNIGSFYGLRFGTRGNEENLEIFEGILREKTMLVYPEKVTISSETAYDKGQAAKNGTSKKVSGYLYDIGDKTREGMIAVGNKLGGNIEKGGVYLTNKIKKNEREEKISEETKEKFKQANVCSKTVLDITKATLEGVFDICKTVGKGGLHLFEKSDAGQKVSTHKNYQGAKEVCKASIHAVSAVLHGMDEALSTLAKSTGYAVTDVIRHKYGNDAGEVAKDGLETIQHVGKVFYAPEDVAVKSIADATAKKK